MKNSRKFSRLAVLTAAAVAVSISAPPGRADEPAKFFKGRAISLLIGFGVGGGYDTYSRVLARHFGNHIPGNPTVVPKNMPGSGGMKVANYLYNVAPKKGSHLGVFAASTALEPLFGGKKAKFETTKFNWIGNMNQDVASCGVWHTSGLTKFSEMQERPVIFGSTGPAAITSQHAKVLKNVLGAKLRIIYGYKGTKGINLAMQRGEVNASCGLFLSSVKSRWDRDVKEGKLRILIQFGRKNVPYFGDAVNIYDLVKSEDTKKTLDIIFRQSEIGRPVAAPPGMPADHTAALRKAFDATMRDPAFLADAKKTRLSIKPMGGATVNKLFASFYNSPKSVIADAKRAIGRK